MKSKIKAGIKAGMVVGTLDILSSFLYFFIKTGNKNVFVILNYIASAIFGKDAASGEAMMIAGLILHYIIALSFSLFFFLIYPKARAYVKSSVLLGILYGLLIWTVMNLVVVPLSMIGARPFSPVNALINAGILIVCIGIPLSFMARGFYEKEIN